MNLTKQIRIYSVDTSAFYSSDELATEVELNKLRAKKNILKSERNIIDQYLSKIITLSKAERLYRRLYYLKKDTTIDNKFTLDRLEEIDVELPSINADIVFLKSNLLSMIEGNTEMRQLRPEEMTEKNVISIFDSFLTRTLNMDTQRIYDDIIVVRAYYFGVLKSIICNGFMYNGNKYICFTASAGQIRTKKTVFIRESTLNYYQRTLMCGLTLDMINSQGGTNRNKYLAYLALCNSATDKWGDFDIRKSIVVNDMETLVTGEVDYIDSKSFTITRKEMDVPISHTDGCGMILPSLTGGDNLMVRAPWIKGLLGVFDFIQFVKEANINEPTVRHELIKDIYGKVHNVFLEDIQVIFTKSQFKMWKFYSSWDEYIDCFDRYKCEVSYCNKEEEYIPNATFNYQMLQTLTDISDDDLMSIAQKTIDKISKIATDKTTMLNVLGAGDKSTFHNNYQKCLAGYPALLSDIYSSFTLKQVKASMIKSARAGKLDVDGKYLFILPDLYAFCEWLFYEKNNPDGLLANGEVSAWLYKSSKPVKLDCLRSPHLYKEHAVRDNVVNAKTEKWFGIKGIYTSCHDLISKILQFDVDGDKSLVIADQTIARVALNNMRGVVPLYYEMAKAGATIIDSEALYDGIVAAYTGGNIGVISNDISKIWDEDNPDIDVIKWLCMQNNFTIDYAKTLFKPDPPREVQDRIRTATNRKLPHFFIYAKDKDDIQVNVLNNHTTNRLYKIIHNKKMSFRFDDVGKFNYRMLKCDIKNDAIIDPKVTLCYDELEKKWRYKALTDKFDDYENDIQIKMLKEMMGYGYLKTEVCDILIDYLFKMKNTKNKSVFWALFGDIVYNNLRINGVWKCNWCSECGSWFVPAYYGDALCPKCHVGISRNEIRLCANCGKAFEVNVHNQKYCSDECRESLVGNTIRCCIDCGNEFEVDSRNQSKTRCDDCQQKYRREIKREWKRNFDSKKK